MRQRPDSQMPASATPRIRPAAHARRGAVALLALLATAGTAVAQTGSGVTAAPDDEAFRSIDRDAQALTQQVLEANRDLTVLQEQLLFPPNTQVAVFVSMDVGTFFDLDSVELKLDGKTVAHYLYSDEESKALLKGGTQELFIGNLKTGRHQLVAFFTGTGPHARDYRRGTTLDFDKGVAAKYVELKVSDLERRQQPEFVTKVWE
jgi:hypothetical protein